MLICLAYHKVEAQLGADAHSVTAQTFRQHLSMIARSAVPVMHPRALATRQSNDALVLTFDDATADHAEVVAPILNEFGFHGLFYVPTAYLDQAGYLSRSQLVALHQGGHVIGSHSHTHPRLPDLPAEAVATELEQSAAAITALVQERPTHFAPPGGLYNELVRHSAQRSGYRFLRTMDWGYNRALDPLRIEVVPMTESMGTRFLRLALSLRGESLFKFAFKAKAALRAATADATYDKLRAALTRASARARS